MKKKATAQMPMFLGDEEDLDNSTGTGNPKVEGVVIGKYKGFTITGRVGIPKKKGNRYVSIQLRQNNGAKWRLYRALGYPHGADITYYESK